MANNSMGTKKVWKNFFSRLGTDIFFCYRENIILKTLKLPMSKGNE